MGFVGVFAKEVGEFGLGDVGEQGGGGAAAVGVEAEVEGAVELEGEAAVGIVDLHGGDAEVGEDDVSAGMPSAARTCGEAGEVGAANEERFRRKTGGAKAGLGSGKFERVGIEAKEASAGLEGAKEFERMAAVAERGVNGGFARLRGKDFEDFAQADGAMRASGGFAAGDDFLDVGGVALGLVFLVFVGEAARMRAGVANAALMGSWG